MASSTLDCPDCKRTVHVGLGGNKNLKIHRKSKTCHTDMKANQLSRPSKLNQSLHAFFRPQVPLNPSTVTAPPPIHANDPGAKASVSEGPKICPMATQLLRDLEAAVKQIPDEKPMGTQENPLSIFAVDLHTCIAEPGEDDWPILNRMLKMGFGWGKAEMAAAIPDMLNQGTLGLDGFAKFMRFFVNERGLEGALFETKINVLIKELGNR